MGKITNRTIDEDIKIKATQIWVDLGANRKAIPEALIRIKEELNLVLPAEGKSLRNWQKVYHLKPTTEQGRALFPELMNNNFIKKSVNKIDVDFDKVSDIFAAQFGEDFENNINLINLINKQKFDLNDEYSKMRLINDIETMTIEDAQKLISILMKRNLSNIKTAIELADYEPKKPGDSDIEFYEKHSIGMRVNHAV